MEVLVRVRTAVRQIDFGGATTNADRAAILAQCLRIGQRSGYRPWLTVATVIYPRDGPASAYFHRHADPVAPVYWLTDELDPLVFRAIARYVTGGSSALSRPRESTRNDNESATPRQRRPSAWRMP